MDRLGRARPKPARTTTAVCASGGASIPAVGSHSCRFLFLLITAPPLHHTGLGSFQGSSFFGLNGCRRLSTFQRRSPTSFALGSISVGTTSPPSSLPSGPTP